jgi:hypothetical protein
MLLSYNPAGCVYDARKITGQYQFWRLPRLSQDSYGTVLSYLSTSFRAMPSEKWSIVDYFAHLRKVLDSG